MKSLVWVVEAIAFVCYLFLLLGLSVTFPFVGILGGTVTSSYYISAIGGLTANWILMVTFIKRGWSKTVLLFSLLPVLLMVGWATQAIFPRLFLVLFLAIGLSMVLISRDYCKFINKKYRKKLVPSTIRIAGGIISIITTILIFWGNF